MLDVHIADSFEAATRSEPVVRIGLDVHRTFFNACVGLTGECPTLRQMKDFFADHTYSGRDLHNLIHDLDIVGQKIAPESPHQAWLTKFREACEVALNNNRSIYVLSD